MLAELSIAQITDQFFGNELLQNSFTGSLRDTAFFYEVAVIYRIIEKLLH